MEGGVEGVGNGRVGTENHYNRKDEGGSEGKPESAGIAVELDGMDGGNPFSEWSWLDVGMVFHGVAGRDLTLQRYMIIFI